MPIKNVFFSYNSVSWSISTEVGFYLLFPLLIWKWERTWWFKLPLVFALAIGAVLFCDHAGFPDDPSDGWAVSRTGILYIHPIARLFEFTIGMTTALLFRRVADKIRLSTAVVTALELAAIALVAVNMVHSVQIIAVLRKVPGIGKSFDVWMVQGPVCCLSFAALIFVSGLQRGGISRLLSHKLGILLGEISFTIYLLHVILLYFYNWKLRVRALSALGVLFVFLGDSAGTGVGGVGGV